MSNIVGRTRGFNVGDFGAEFAHVGQRFGDPFEIEPQIISDVESRDREIEACAYRKR